MPKTQAEIIQSIENRRSSVNKRIEQIKNRRIRRMGRRFKGGDSSSAFNMDKWKNYFTLRPSFSSEQYQIFCDGFLATVRNKNLDHGIVLPAYELIYPNGNTISDQETINDPVERILMSDARANGFNYSKIKCDNGVGRKSFVEHEDWKNYMLRQHRFYTSDEYKSFCNGFLEGVGKKNPTHSIVLPSYETIYQNGPKVDDENNIAVNNNTNNNNNNNNNNNPNHTSNPLLLLAEIADIYLGNSNVMDDNNEDDENNANKKKQKIDGSLN